LFGVKLNRNYYTSIKYFILISAVEKQLGWQRDLGFSFPE